jgi:hypothetical protein
MSRKCCVDGERTRRHDVNSQEMRYKTEKQGLMGNIWELSLYATEVMYKVSDTDYKGE